MYNNNWVPFRFVPGYRGYPQTNWNEGFFPPLEQHEDGVDVIPKR